jgi:glyoxylate reductase
MTKTRPRVFITRAIALHAVAKLRKHAIVEVWPRDTSTPYRELMRRAANVDALLTMVTDRIDANLIASAPKLRVISNLAVGLDNIDVAAATAAGIAVGHTPGVLTDATADLAFALLMATARRVAEGDREVRAGKWQT